MPWSRFRDIHGRGVDTVLGPEMRSTGEVMGIDSVFGTAYAKSQAGAYGPLPTKGRAFISVANRDKRSMIFPARELVAHGFELMATSGTAEVLKRNGINATVVRKQSEGTGPNARRPSSSSSTTRGRPHRQHAVRHQRPPRRLRHPYGGRGPLRALPDDGPGAGGGGAGHRRPQPRRRGSALTPGTRRIPDRRPRLAAPRGTPETVSPSS